MITKNMVKSGYETGLIKLILSPFGDGVVCSIWDNWFYFGGTTAEECKTVNEYTEAIPTECIINDIFEVLEGFKTEFRDEYLCYEYYLREHGIAE